MTVVALSLLAAALTVAEPDAMVLEFTAPSRCPPCQQIAPTVTRLQREGLPIKAIDVDTNPTAAAPYRLRAVPTFVLVIAGREVDRIEGKPEEHELRRMCERARLANAAADPEPQTPPQRGWSKSESEALIAPSTKAAESTSASTDARSQSQNSKPTTDTITAPSTASGKPATVDSANAKFDTKPAPVIRAKHDGSVNLPAVTSSDLRHVCPRIRVKDAHGVNFGTGTIIDSLEGRTTILTCGHIFRKLDDKSVIEVDVFNGEKHETFVGRMLRYDLDADVGLLWIPTTGPLPTAGIAGLSSAAAVGQHVFSVGCSGGDAPTKLQHKVTALNRYLGPDNIECTGVPVQGRSGGGLFDTNGNLVGVCIAADQRDQRGLYAGLKPIHELLHQTQLGHLLPKLQDRPQPDLLAARKAELRQDEPADSKVLNEEEAFVEQVPAVSELPDRKSPFAETNGSHVASGNTASETTPLATTSESEIAGSAELKAALADAGEAEVVCIIRPLSNPRAASRVVIINRASTKFLNQLSGEMEQQAQPTTAVIRHAKYPAEVRPYRRLPSR